MKHLLSTLSLCALSLSLVGCVAIDPGMLDGYGSPPPPSYRRDYDAPPRYYGDNRDYGHRDYDHRYDSHDYHSSSHSSDRNYYGGPAEWYKSGVGIGKKDRKEHQSQNYRRHKSQYDGKTENEFARGYNDGYRRG